MTATFARPARRVKQGFGDKLTGEPAMGVTHRLVLAGPDIVLPDRVIAGGTLVVEDGLITGIVSHALPASSGALHLDLTGHFVVPGFVDIHVHGLEGIDSLDGPDAVRDLAARMPAYGVTAFSPTTVACPPAQLRMVLDAVRACRESPAAGSARVLPAHLESNFINPDYKGAQPLSCIRTPASALATRDRVRRCATGDEFSGADILHLIEDAGPDVGIVTLAPELDEAMA
ncbi:MAG: hypothetical protein WCP29_19730, partial [Acidobacteriota bacterium]